MATSTGRQPFLTGNSEKEMADQGGCVPTHLCEVSTGTANFISKRTEAACEMLAENPP